MNKIVLLILVVCALTSSCAAQETSILTPAIPPKPSTNIPPNIVIIATNNVDQCLHVYALIFGFKEANTHYPNSKEALVKYYRSFTNAPNIDADLELLSSLSFVHGTNKSFTISWETKEAPPVKNWLTFEQGKDCATGSLPTQMRGLHKFEPPRNPSE